jgi:DNA-binding CsgD family transcriptional regulator
VPTLSRGDSERLLRFVGEAETIGGDQPFTPELLVELGRLVEADRVGYCELDRVRRRTLLTVDRYGDPEEDDNNNREDDDSLDGPFWSLVVAEHPVCLRHQQGDFRALKLTDFLSLRQLHETLLYEAWFKPWGIERELNVPIPSPLWHTKTFLFDRGPGRDFTERDRLVLDLLQPHLARLWQSARTRRLLEAALSELDTRDENEPTGVVFLGLEGEALSSTPPARRLLRTYFSESTGGRLPSPVSEWLDSGAAAPLRRRRPGRRLDVERSGKRLLLRETRIEAELTSREREVLAWVARGKTNAEVARVLWLAPSTVRKHLENVYAKLGVTTRTAAVARFLGVIDAEAS